jgi:hypothetical protein
VVWWFHCSEPCINEKNEIVDENLNGAIKLVEHAYVVADTIALHCIDVDTLVPSTSLLTLKNSGFPSATTGS